MKTERKLVVEMTLDGLKPDEADEVVRQVHKRVADAARWALLAASKKRDMRFTCHVAREEE